MKEFERQFQDSDRDGGFSKLFLPGVVDGVRRQSRWKGVNHVVDLHFERSH
jgi:hypothetical protein